MKGKPFVLGNIAAMFLYSIPLIYFNGPSNELIITHGWFLALHVGLVLITAVLNVGAKWGRTSLYVLAVLSVAVLGSLLWLLNLLSHLY